MALRQEGATFRVRGRLALAWAARMRLGRREVISAALLAWMIIRGAKNDEQTDQSDN